MNIVILGTYDLGKPRVRILREATYRISENCIEIHKDVWSGIEDKSQIEGTWNKIFTLLRWVSAYPVLAWNYIKSPKHKVVLIPYFGLLDIFIFWPLVKIKGARIYWDVFFSTYDTVVRDRKLVGSSSIRAKLLYLAEYIASRISDVPFLDTKSHAQYFGELFRLPDQTVSHIPVGVEDEKFKRYERSEKVSDRKPPIKLLFYGQFIPLHGLDVLLGALQQWEISGPFKIEMTIIGTGQEAPRIDQKLIDMGGSLKLLKIIRVNWVPYEDLQRKILESDICCGIFGTSEKAKRVIPNKVYQILSMGKPLITSDTSAIRELITPGPAVELVMPGNSESLFDGLKRLSERILTDPASVYESTRKMPVYNVEMVASDLQRLLCASENCLE